MGISKFGVIGLLVILVFVSSTISAKIQLYKDGNYSSLEVSPTETCYNLPSDKKLAVYSVATDTCFIAFNALDCMGAWSRKLMPGKTSMVSHNGLFTVSLISCNDQEGGPQLNVDITTHFKNALHPNRPIIPNVLESYHDVCICQNVPKYVQDLSEWSINNHHNGLFVYFEPDCTVQHLKALYIDAGHWTNSRDTHKLSSSYNGTTIKIQSFGPDPNTTYFQQSCSKYSNDKIMKIELLGLSNISFRYTATILNETTTNLAIEENDDPMNFFAEYNFKGFNFGSRSTSKCYNFPKPIQRRMVNGVLSIQTKTCVILYLEDNCVGRSIKIEAPGSTNLTHEWESTVKGERTLSLLYNEYPNWKWGTKSYHVCNKDKGGPTLNLEIYTSDPKVRKDDAPIILESYENVCLCQNVPNYVQQLDSWSIDNNGNSMIAYFSPDCVSSTHSPLWIPAGQSSYSLGLSLFEKIDESTGTTQKIQSFGPDHNSEYYIKNCNKNCTELTLLADGQTTELKSTRKICGFDPNSESTQIALVILERMETYEAKLEQAALNLENTKHEFDDKLEKQRDEIQDLTNKLDSYIHE